MTHPPVFKGVATALATPFYKDGIDWTAFGRLIEFQLAHGVDALVVCGTTGESATLSAEEQARAVDFCVRQTRGRVPVIAGAGSNDTRRACRLAERAAICGADAILAVTPYYNKATASGLFEHYRAICESSEKPVIVYNVPSRTGVNITPEQYARLCELPGVAGVKEADADIEKTVRTLALCREKTYVYCGNDTLFLPFLALGGAGAVSVVSNAAPMRMKKLYSAFAAGDIKTALRIQDGLTATEKLLFCEPNPVPVKALLARMGLCRPDVRLPLTEMEKENARKLFAAAEEIIKSEDAVTEKE